MPPCPFFRLRETLSFIKRFLPLNNFGIDSGLPEIMETSSVHWFKMNCRFIIKAPWLGWHYINETGYGLKLKRIYFEYLFSESKTGNCQQWIIAKICQIKEEKDGAGEKENFVTYQLCQSRVEMLNNMKEKYSITAVFKWIRLKKNLDSVGLN